MEYYFIAALSFAIMYSINYSWEIVLTVVDMLNMNDIDYNDEQSTWTPTAYIIAVFISSFLAMPFYLYIIIFKNRYETIKKNSIIILEEHFGFERYDDN